MSDDITLVRPGALECIGDAIAERLRIVFPPQRFEHAVMPSRVDASTWGKLLRRTPFIGLGWADLDPVRGAGRLFHGTSAWTVYLVVKNPAGARERYWGDRQGPGLFVMVRAAVGILHGHTIEGVGTIQVIKSGNAFAEGWNDESYAMAAVDCAVGTTLPLAEQIKGVEEDALARLGISWTFEGGTASPELSDVMTMGSR